MIVYRVALLIAIFSLPAAAATHHVSKDGNGTDGQTWKRAFPAIGEALALASAGDEVWVASGTYHEVIELPTGVALFGGFHPPSQVTEFEDRDWKSFESIIDATGLERSAVVIHASCTIDGFTITGGYSIGRDGGGISVGTRNTSGSIVRNNLITRNISFGGGGGGIAQFHGAICDNTISHNWSVLDATITGTVGSGQGGGLYRCDGEIYRNVISTNNLGNTKYRSGGGLARCDGVISKNIIVSNLGWSGGGIAGSSGRIENNLIVGNIAETPPNERLLKGITMEFLANGAGLDQCRGEVINNTIVDNISEHKPAGISISIVSNCIAFYNLVSQSGEQSDIGLESSERYCCIGVDDRTLDGSPAGVGSIGDEPSFVDREGGDYRLLSSSPCIDTATDTDLTTDIEGNRRPVDVIGVGRDGQDAYDMGAYEFQIPRSDLNGDGYTNHVDLMIFQQDWMKVSGS